MAGNLWNVYGSEYFHYFLVKPAVHAVRYIYHLGKIKMTYVIERSFEIGGTTLKTCSVTISPQFGTS